MIRQNEFAATGERSRDGESAMQTRGFSLVIGFIYITAICSGCSSPLSSQQKFILKNGDQYQLMLVHAQHFDRWQRPGTFHGCIVDKTLMLTDRESRRKLVNVLWWDPWTVSGGTACLFNPHYGIHITRGEQTLDFLICFNCMQCNIFDSQGASASSMIDPDGKTDLAALIPG